MGDERKGGRGKRGGEVGVGRRWGGGVRLRVDGVCGTKETLVHKIGEAGGGRRRGSLGHPCSESI